MAASIPKVLVLHGFCQNAAILRKQMRKLCEALVDDVEFVFVDAPHPVVPVDLRSPSDGVPNPPDPGPRGLGTEQSPPVRTWWHRDESLQPAFGLLRNILAEDRYQGIFGFSQGAAMAAVLTAALERPLECPMLLVNGQPIHPPFQYHIAVGGFRPWLAEADRLLATPYATPTLVVVGRNDVVSPMERVQTLVDVATTTRIMWHPGGHFVPIRKTWPDVFRRYMREHTMSRPSPDSISAQDALPVDVLEDITNTPASKSLSSSKSAETPRIHLRALWKESLPIEKGRLGMASCYDLSAGFVEVESMEAPPVTAITPLALGISLRMNSLCPGALTAGSRESPHHLPPPV